MPKRKNKSINLLPQEEFDASIVGRVLKWTMQTFRVMVIVTEMIVMAAFLSRFWLDAKNSDLNEEIDVKSAQIKAQADFEKEFRDLQTRLKIFAEMEKNRKASDALVRVASKIPVGINLSSVAFQESEAQVKGVAGSEISIAQFISNLAADESFGDVSLGQVNQSVDNPSLTVFTIAIKY